MKSYIYCDDRWWVFSPNAVDHAPHYDWNARHFHHHGRSYSPLRRRDNPSGCYGASYHVHADGPRTVGAHLAVVDGFDNEQDYHVLLTRRRTKSDYIPITSYRLGTARTGVHEYDSPGRKFNFHPFSSLFSASVTFHTYSKSCEILTHSLISGNQWSANMRDAW